MTNQNSNAGSGRQSRRPGSGRREAAWGEVSDWLDDWIAIEKDGSITAFSGKVELGTGVRTALAQIVAEELDVAFEQVHMVMGDTERTPDEGYTAGSMTIVGSGSALRRAAAEARHVMLTMASERLDANIDELAVQDGMVSVIRYPERSITYTELMGGNAFNLQVTNAAALKKPERYRIVGTSVPREDLPRKVVGQSGFIHDFRVPGMLHGRVVRSPSPTAQLLALDETSVKDIPGVIKLVQRGNFIGVVAEREEQAIAATKQLKVEWQETVAYPPMQDLYAVLRSQPTQDHVVIERGDFEHAFTGAAQQVHATYYQPYHAHASIGPSCAVAQVNNDNATVWASTPGPYQLSGALAQLLELPAENVHVIHREGPGAYGQNGSDDVAADAAILAQAIGRPVRVQWSRQDEFAWEPKAAAMVMEIHAGLDVQGKVVAWDYHAWSPSHTARPRFATQLIATQLISGQTPPKPRFFFGAERNALTNYDFPVQRVTIHYISNSPLHVSSFRTLGGAQNTFANESFMDELAVAANVDPVEYRLRYLTDPREREVLHTATSTPDTISTAVIDLQYSSVGQQVPNILLGNGITVDYSKDCTGHSGNPLLVPAPSCYKASSTYVAGTMAHEVAHDLLHYDGTMYEEYQAMLVGDIVRNDLIQAGHGNKSDMRNDLSLYTVDLNNKNTKQLKSDLETWFNNYEPDYGPKKYDLPAIPWWFWLGFR